SLRMYWLAAHCEEKSVTPRVLSEYKDLIRLFVNRLIPVADFERRYLRMFKDDPAIRSENEYEILNRLFGDIDAFSADPELRSERGLDEEQLRAEADAALDALCRLEIRPLR